MKKCMKSDIALFISAAFSVVGMFGVAFTYSCEIHADFVAWWCMATIGTMMLPFCKEF